MIHFISGNSHSAPWIAYTPQILLAPSILFVEACISLCLCPIFSFSPSVLLNFHTLRWLGSIGFQTFWSNVILSIGGGKREAREWWRRREGRESGGEGGAGGRVAVRGSGEGKGREMVIGEGEGGERVTGVFPGGGGGYCTDQKGDPVLFLGYRVEFLQQ